VQAALASAASFAAGALIPIAATLLAPAGRSAMAIAGTTLLALLGLGGLAAHAGGSPRLRGALRVAFWGALAMGMTALVGRLFHTAV
jgi:VIT1/CCC1 family predicted Fe2+/Mn2+ transporter